MSALPDHLRCTKHDPQLQAIFAANPCRRASDSMVLVSILCGPRAMPDHKAQDETMGYVHTPLTDSQAEVIAVAADDAPPLKLPNEDSQKSRLHRELSRFGLDDIDWDGHVPIAVLHARNNTDQADAVELLCLDGDISEELAEKIDQYTLKFAALRLRREMSHG